jgi:hypothetical protein
MATINLSPLTAEQESLDRRRKMAEAMQQQAILPIEMPTVPGAKVSPLQGFAKLLQGYIAGKNLERAEEEKKQYEADTMGDFAKILRNTGKYTTIAGTPAVPEQTTDVIEPNIANQNLQAVAARQMARDPNAPISPFERQIGEDERTQISQLPLESTQKMVTPAVAGTPDRQIPLLSPELLSDPNFMKTSSGRMMLAQALMQQQAQQQAEALRKREAEQAIQSVAPGATLFQGGKAIYTNPKDLPIQSVAPGATLFQGGKAIYTNPKDSPIREIKTIDTTTGMPVTKYVPENVLLSMGAIPDQFKGFAADLIMAKNLPAQIMNDPQLLNLVGSQLNKQAGQVTQEDVANYMLRVAETRAKLGYEGIPFKEPAGLTAAPNPLVKPDQKTTTQAEIAEVAKKSGKTIEQVTQDAIAKGYKVQ